MIVSLEGILREQSPLYCILDVQGVGYGVHIPLTVNEKLPPIGQNVQLHTHPVYRADAQDLYGFLEREDRQLFQLLIQKVSGIGPRLGIAILSRLERQALRQAIAQRNTRALSQIPGIGKKTAERIIVELSDAMQKLEPSLAPPSGVSSSSVRDAIEALVTLGYKMPDAEKVILKTSQLLGEQASTELLLRHALRNGTQ
ncbi:MAG: Holliday junction branch migration protein RuvA [Puniceicoccales bacterium]|jgi:Holliday junction DNA helicase RuvA|nr:Holliday junction branch migration protein RuvA [Puniceicoccales bacterium]